MTRKIFRGMIWAALLVSVVLTICLSGCGIPETEEETGEAEVVMESEETILTEDTLTEDILTEDIISEDIEVEVWEVTIIDLTED